MIPGGAAAGAVGVVSAPLVPPLPPVVVLAVVWDGVGVGFLGAGVGGGVVGRGAAAVVGAWVGIAGMAAGAVLGAVLGAGRVRRWSGCGGGWGLRGGGGGGGDGLRRVALVAAEGGAAAADQDQPADDPEEDLRALGHAGPARRRADRRRPLRLEAGLGGLRGLRHGCSGGRGGLGGACSLAAPPSMGGRCDQPVTDRCAPETTSGSPAEAEEPEVCCAPPGTRTPDPLIKSQLL